MNFPRPGLPLEESDVPDLNLSYIASENENSFYREEVGNAEMSVT